MSHIVEHGREREGKTLRYLTYTPKLETDTQTHSSKDNGYSLAVEKKKVIIVMGSISLNNMDIFMKFSYYVLNSPKYF